MGRAVKHGMSHSKIYYVWRNMRNRCLNKSDIAYSYYGGRGISVCKEWQESFEAFYKDMGDPPEGMSIDRINNSAGYSPDNCRWATREEQQANSRTCKQYKNNTSRIAGVTKRGRLNGWCVQLNSVYVGSSTDFFEACCLRKSAENRA